MSSLDWRSRLADLDSEAKLVYYALLAECGDPGGDGLVFVNESQIARWTSLALAQWDAAAARLFHIGAITQQTKSVDGSQPSRCYLAAWRLPDA